MDPKAYRGGDARTLQREVTDADEKLKRLYRLVEDGLTDLDEVLQDRLDVLKADRDRAKAALERIKGSKDLLEGRARKPARPVLVFADEY